MTVIVLCQDSSSGMPWCATAPASPGGSEYWSVGVVCGAVSPAWAADAVALEGAGPAWSTLLEPPEQPVASPPAASATAHGERGATGARTVRAGRPCRPRRVILATGRTLSVR